MPKQGRGKAARCFLGSSHCGEKPEAKQEATLGSEPVWAPAPVLLPLCWKSGPDPGTPTPPSLDEAWSPKVGQWAEAPNKEMIFERPLIIIIIFTHKKLKPGKPEMKKTIQRRRGPGICGHRSSFTEGGQGTGSSCPRQPRLQAHLGPGWVGGGPGPRSLTGSP